MPAGVITVAGKKFAVGLYWQVSDSTNASKSARQAALQPGAVSDFFCVRPGNAAKGRAPQFGLGEEKAGHKWNMPTAAITLANRQPGSWVGVFTVPEGMWFIEVRDDLIAPEGDQLFADEAEAMLRLQEASARGGLERIYAPPSWAIPGAEASSLAALVSGKADGRLQPVKVPKQFVMAVLGGAVAIVIIIMIGLYVSSAREEAEAQRMVEEQQRQAEIQRRMSEEEARKAEEERQRQMAQQAMQMPTYQRVWEQSPPPLVWMKACHTAMEKIPLAPLGWTLASAKCSGSQFAVTWSRSTGPAVVPEGGQVDAGLRQAAGSYELPQLEARGPQQLWPGEAISLYILHNDWQADVSYMADDVPPPLPNGQRVPPPPWLKRSVRWTVPLAPWTLKGPLVDFPGLIINSLTMNMDGSWLIEGVLYEQRK